MDVPAGEIDRISALPHNVLHVILGRLGYAPAITRTAVLSRRWRHVWTGAKSLTFKDSDKYLINRSDFVGFVDWALAQRAADADMESLKIEFTNNKLQAPASPEKVSEWLRYATQHVVQSVVIDIGNYDLSSRKKQQQQAVVEVPSHGKAASIFLVLPNHRFQLLPHNNPAGARHEALTKLELFSLSFSSDGRELTDFVSFCCPRLRRLLVCGPNGLRRLTLRSNSLEDFSISAAAELQTLDVAAPNLRVFYMCLCFTYRKIYGNNSNEYVDGTDDKLVRIMAPKLEEIVSMYNSRRSPADLDIHDLTSVRRLTDLHLDMHGKFHSSPPLTKKPSQSMVIKCKHGTVLLIVMITQLTSLWNGK
ncbi:hypothetical protein QOZ80_7AG0554490 [Eleusine coracana subsp. coracana]|nr:hypothetical protein QOZ80_7AG0554490 [Eleusine coracana subsp. coracana]